MRNHVINTNRSAWNVELGAQRWYFSGKYEVTDLKAHDWQALKSWYIQSNRGLASILTEQIEYQ